VKRAQHRRSAGKRWGRVVGVAFFCTVLAALGVVAVAGVASASTVSLSCAVNFNAGSAWISCISSTASEPLTMSGTTFQSTAGAVSGTMSGASGAGYHWFATAGTGNWTIHEVFTDGGIGDTTGTTWGTAAAFPTMPSAPSPPTTTTTTTLPATTTTTVPATTTTTVPATTTTTVPAIGPAPVPARVPVLHSLDHPLSVSALGASASCVVDISSESATYAPTPINKANAGATITTSCYLDPAVVTHGAVVSMFVNIATGPTFFFIGGSPSGWTTSGSSDQQKYATACTTLQGPAGVYPAGYVSAVCRMNVIASTGTVAVGAASISDVQWNFADGTSYYPDVTGITDGHVYADRYTAPMSPFYYFGDGPTDAGTDVCGLGALGGGPDFSTTIPVGIMTWTFEMENSGTRTLRLSAGDGGGGVTDSTDGGLSVVLGVDMIVGGDPASVFPTLLCTRADGTSVLFNLWELAGLSPIIPGPGHGPPDISLCFKGTGIGLNPSSWVPAMGRAMFCILTDLFVPYDFVRVTTMWNLIQTKAPVSFVYDAITFLPSSVTHLAAGIAGGSCSSSSPTLSGLTADPTLAIRAPCILTTAGGATITLLRSLVYAMFVIMLSLAVLRATNKVIG
jgi:hypothetical protein